MTQGKKTSNGNGIIIGIIAIIAFVAAFLPIMVTAIR